jgi:hypothetical protein
MGLPNTPVIQSSALNITVFRCISFFQSWMSIRYALREFVIIELVGIDIRVQCRSRRLPVEQQLHDQCLGQHR